MTSRPRGAESGRALYVACLVLEKAFHEGDFGTGRVEVGLRKLGAQCLVSEAH